MGVAHAEQATAVPNEAGVFELRQHVLTFELRHVDTLARSAAVEDRLPQGTAGGRCGWVSDVDEPAHE